MWYYFILSTVRKVCLQSGMYITRDDDFNRLVVIIIIIITISLILTKLESMLNCNYNLYTCKCTVLSMEIIECSDTSAALIWVTGFSYCYLHLKKTPCLIVSLVSLLLHVNPIFFTKKMIMVCSLGCCAVFFSKTLCFHSASLHHLVHV